MDLSDIKIGSPKNENPDDKDKKEKEEDKVTDTDATDYMIEGASGGEQLLGRIKEIKADVGEEVIYGIYNNSDKSTWVKIDDFLIDRSKVSLKDKSYFFHMLAVMVDAGIPVVSAVKSLADRTDNRRFRRILNTVAYYCREGSTLADAMSRFEDVFDEAEIGIIRSGEATGRLHVMLFKLSSELDNKHELSMKLWGAAVYPIAVLFVLLIVAIAMLVWVFPTLLSLLTEGGVAPEDLPFQTKLLINLQSGFVNWWWLILIIILGLYGVFSVYKSSEYGAFSWDYRKLKIPIIGGLIRKVSVLRFISLLGLLIESGLPVIRCLKISGSSISNRVYKMKVQEVIDSVRTGGKISESLEDVEFLFPGEVVQMIRVGEKSASLGKISEKVSDQYQKEVDNTLKKLSSVFEPVMIVVVGLFVALLAMAIMAPIFNLSSVISV